ncbi:MAG TPA: hypothetical protein VNU93_01980, partial [Verrucomicrobiae bacterium]|nr:hypothetical protein [Verrucomicrobiae bacterium]
MTKAFTLNCIFPPGLKAITNIFFFFLLLFTGPLMAQTTFTCPNADRCVSKDLEVVRAYITGVPQCQTCTPGTTVTTTITLEIANKTGSTRTSFALFGTFQHGSSSQQIFICGGSIPPKNADGTPSITPIISAPVTFICGEQLSLTNNFVAWTDASDGDRNSCSGIQADNCSSIAPKCGTAASIVIEAPISAPQLTPTQPTCTVATGSITVTSPLGSTLTYKLDNGTYQSSPNFTGVAPGTHTVTVRNADGCTASNTVTINAQPQTPTAPTLGTTQPTCTVATGTITVTSSTTGLTFSLNSTAAADFTNTTGVFAGLAPGTYTIRARNADGCISAGTQATIGAAPQI